MFIRFITIFAFITLISGAGFAAEKTVSLDPSDETFLSEAPVEPLPDPEPLAEVVDESVVGKEEEKPKKKQVYKGTPDVSMQRSIKDDRIDDGYVQGLIQQRAQ